MLGLFPAACEPLLLVRSSAFFLSDQAGERPARGGGCGSGWHGKASGQRCWRSGGEVSVALGRRSCPRSWPGDALCFGAAFFAPTQIPSRGAAACLSMPTSLAFRLSPGKRLDSGLLRAGATGSARCCCCLARRVCRVLCGWEEHPWVLDATILPGDFGVPGRGGKRGCHVRGDNCQSFPKDKARGANRPNHYFAPTHGLAMAVIQ